MDEYPAPMPRRAGTASDAVSAATAHAVADPRRRQVLRSAPLGLAASLIAFGAPRRARGADIPALTSASKPSIVAIGTFQRMRSPAFAFAGTGFAIGSGNLIATCAHVLPTLDPADRSALVVAIPGGETTRIAEARLVHVNRDADLAVLRIEGTPLRPMPLGDEALPAEGSEIVMIGFPIGAALGLFPATHRGLVAAIAPMALPTGTAAQLNAQNVQRLRGTPIDILQLDATAYPGNSGSPVIETGSGRVVGVVNMVLVKGARESVLSAPSGISYAVPVRYLLALLSTK